MRNKLRALKMGILDGWQAGPEIDCGMSYEEPELQNLYDGGTHVGCGLAVLLSKGWAISF